MSRLGALILGVMVGAGGVYGSLNYHVVRNADGYNMVRKLETTFEETYIDARQFGVSDWFEHPQVVKAIVKADKKDLLGEAAADSLAETVSGALDKLRK